MKRVDYWHNNRALSKAVLVLLAVAVSSGCQPENKGGQTQNDHDVYGDQNHNEDMVPDQTSDRQGVSLPDNELPDSNKIDGFPAFRFSVKFGTVNEWQGLTMLLPDGRIWTEKCGQEGCQKEANLKYLEQFSLAFSSALPDTWQASYLPGDLNYCPPDTLYYSLEIELPGAGKAYSTQWCGTPPDDAVGLDAVIKKVNKLKADVTQNGKCGYPPYKIPKTDPSAQGGEDDGLQHITVAMMFDSLKFCLVGYFGYGIEVYTTNHSWDYDDEELKTVILSALAGEDSSGFKQLAQICPDVSQLGFSASPNFVDELAVPAALFLVDLADNEPKIWVATKGIAALLPNFGEEGEVTVSLTNIYLRRITSLSPLTIDWSPWLERWIGNTQAKF